jgi:hypothetical protein
MKKVLSIAAAFALILSLSVTSVFAAAIGTGVVESSDTTITIPKGVTFINEDAVTSNGPGITFSYTVAPASVTAGQYTVKDADGHITSVNPGPAAGLSLDASTLTFGANETFTTSAAGVEATKNLSLSVDTSAFTKPGVYRYVITDTTAKADLFAAGITRDDNYQTTRYIDVFITRDSNDDFVVAGYALKTTNDSTDGSANPATPKDPGFVSSSDVEDGTPADTDRYETYNVTITKEVDGAMGDVEHEFPFAITVSNQSKPFLAGEGTTASTSNTSLSATLKHGDTYTIQGLSPKATFSVVETNDTTDLYTVTVAGSSSAISVTENAQAKTYAIAAGAVSTYDTDNSASSVNELGDETNYSAVTYTNTLDEVSPTGLVLRYGPFMILFAAALVILAASKHSDAQDAK